MSARLEIFGTEQVVRNLSTYKINLLREIVKGCEAVQAYVINIATSIVPVDTGNLQRSIKVGGIEISDTNVSAIVMADAEYASYVEFGTSRQKSQPYMGPAILAGQKIFVQAIEAARDRAAAQ